MDTEDFGELRAESDHELNLLALGVGDSVLCWDAGATLVSTDGLAGAMAASSSTLLELDL